MSREPRTEWINLTPRLAKSFLSDQHQNRTINSRYVEHLAAEIKAGRWRDTHEGIATDWDGRMVDGQHRCMAVIFANKSIKVQLTTGISRETALLAVDQGRVRTAGQLLHMRGVKNSSATAAILRVLTVLTSETESFGIARSPTADAKLLEVYGDRIESIIARCGLKRLVAPVLAPIVIDPDETFIEGITTGANLAPGSPILALTQHLQVHRGAATVGTRVGFVMRTIAALDAHHRSDTMSRMAMSSVRYTRWARRHHLPVNKTLIAMCGGE